MPPRSRGSLGVRRAVLLCAAAAALCAAPQPSAAPSPAPSAAPRAPAAAGPSAPPAPAAAAAPTGLPAAGAAAAPTAAPLGAPANSSNASAPAPAEAPAEPSAPDTNVNAIVLGSAAGFALLVLVLCVTAKLMAKFRSPDVEAAAAESVVSLSKSDPKACMVMQLSARNPLLGYTTADFAVVLKESGWVLDKAQGKLDAGWRPPDKGSAKGMPLRQQSTLKGMSRERSITSPTSAGGTPVGNRSSVTFASALASPRRFGASVDRQQRARRGTLTSTSPRSARRGSRRMTQVSVGTSRGAKSADEAETEAEQEGEYNQSFGRLALPRYSTSSQPGTPSGVQRFATAQPDASSAKRIGQRPGAAVGRGIATGSPPARRREVRAVPGSPATRPAEPSTPLR